ncbi:sulfotransferase family 2 domain-containing protein [Roseococcus thiosulfatophilus]|uniref:sulfotransferase family 2 domain-containing protein n=1 Tax=Roseococcus thiosulfatophilus TaxID=35813 RepID=UPI001A8CBDEA|nr:sulfotransferase family 2 domain-containing protein [Roseococcus thiosulfatophilus]
MTAPDPLRAHPAILVFLHLPRTGGTTLHEALSKHHAPDEICPMRLNRLEVLPPEDIARYRFFSGHYRFEHVALTPTPRVTVTVLREPRERVVSLWQHWRRHWPSVTHKNEGVQLAQELGLRDFLRSDHLEVLEAFDNALARQLAGDCRARAPGVYTRWAWKDRAPLTEEEIVEAACRNLSSFDLVGFTGALDPFHAAVCARMGWSGPAHLPRTNGHDQEVPGLYAVPDEPIPPETQVELDRVTRLDRRVWDYALARAGEDIVWTP